MRESLVKQTRDKARKRKKRKTFGMMFIYRKLKVEGIDKSMIKCLIKPLPT